MLVLVGGRPKTKTAIMTNTRESPAEDDVHFAEQVCVCKDIQYMYIYHVGGRGTSILNDQ